MRMGRALVVTCCAFAGIGAAAWACGGDDNGGGGVPDGSADVLRPPDGAPPDDARSDAIADGGKASEICTDDGWCWANPLPQGNGLYAVYASSATNVWTGGMFGTILHWEGTKWSAVSSGTTKNLRAMFGFGPSDIWAGTEG